MPLCASTFYCSPLLKLRITFNRKENDMKDKLSILNYRLNKIVIVFYLMLAVSGMCMFGASIAGLRGIFISLIFAACTISLLLVDRLNLY